jgi:exopolyphosphatase/guanosine-5'-triphosphate,3'-diphosphate pyrophosphatase
MASEAGRRPGLGPARRPARRGFRGRRPSSEDDGGRGGATYAALDLGTNNCRLLIARPTREGFRVVDAFSRIVRLGEGVGASGRLSDAAIERTMAALVVCRAKMRNRGVTRARLVATEACRAAQNAGEFCARVAEQLGMELEIIDRRTEAELAATGCAPLIDPRADGVMLFDIGGGSSELVRLNRPRFAPFGPPLPQIRDWISLPHGVVTLAERHGGIDVSRAIYERMVAEVSATLASFARAHAGDGLNGIHMLGTSGTVTTIAGVHLNLRRYDRDRVDGCWMTADDISAVVERLLGMSYQDRVASPCIGVERADLVLAGCAILEAIRRAFPCRRLRVADRGLREGMLVQMMRDDGVWDADGSSASLS